jgi:hypothetical protein
MQNQISHHTLIGKLVIIGISFYDSNDDLIDTFQTHGIIEKSDNIELLRIIKKDNHIFQLPFDPDTIQKAPLGKYSEKHSSTIITNPDYMILWNISVKNQDDIDEIKEFGYIV